MRAVTLSTFGGPECLGMSEVPDPRPTAGRTIVLLHAAALNWHDVLVRRGQYGSPLPHVLGADGAGIAIDTGEPVVVLPSLGWGADERAPDAGWEILGDRVPGTYAEYVSVPTECVFPLPAGLSWSEGASLPLVGVTTYRALFSRAGLTSGESLLVLGSGGGVATMAVALAASIGCHVVVTSSSDAKISRAVSLGAADGVLYTDPEWPTLAREMSPGGRGFDVVLDAVGSWASSLRALRLGGRLVVLGSARSERANLAVRPFYFGQYSLLGTTMGSPRDFAGLLDFISTHSVPPPIVDRTFALSDAAMAHEYLETGNAFGKVVLTIIDEDGNARV